MKFEQTPKTEFTPEQKEKLHEFLAELRTAVESIAGLTEADFIQQNSEVLGDEESAGQMYHELEFPLRGFDAWDESLSAEMIKMFQAEVLQGHKLMETFIQKDGAKITVVQTKNNDLLVLRVKNKDGRTEWILKPFEAKIKK